MSLVSGTINTEWRLLQYLLAGIVNCHLTWQDGVHVNQLDTAACGGITTTASSHVLLLGHLVPPPHGSGPGEEAPVSNDTTVIVLAVGASEARDVNIHIHHLDCLVLLHDGKVEDSSCR